MERTPIMSKRSVRRLRLKLVKAHKVPESRAQIPSLTYVRAKGRLVRVHNSLPLQVIRAGREVNR